MLFKRIEYILIIIIIIIANITVLDVIICPFDIGVVDKLSFK